MIAEQRALHFLCEGQSLVGIIDVPERPLARGVLVLSCGPHCRVGSHRQYALMARLLAPRGIAVMRFDCRGAGDSDGQAASGAALEQDIGAAIREFCRQMPGLTDIVLWGLGESACAAALYAPTDARVKGLVLLHPWSGAADPAAAPPPLLARLGERGFWKRVGSRDHVALDAGLPLAQRVIASLACFSGAALVVAGGADAAGRQFAEPVRQHDSAWRHVTIAGANPTFASRAWRDEVAELCANWLVSW